MFGWDKMFFRIIVDDIPCEVASVKSSLGSSMQHAFKTILLKKKTVRMSKDVFKNAVIEIILYIVLNLILFTIIIILFVTVYLIFTNSDVNNKIIYYIYYIKSRQQYIINFYNLSTN